MHLVVSLQVYRGTKQMDTSSLLVINPVTQITGLARMLIVLVALLCFKWAKQGGAPKGLERYILMALIATQLATAAAYARKGVMGPPVVYVTASAIMGVAAAKGI